MTSEMVERAWTNIGFFLYQLNPDVRRLVRRLECLHLKILKKKQSLAWQQHPTRHQLYGHLPPITKTIQVR